MAGKFSFTIENVLKRIFLFYQKNFRLILGLACFYSAASFISGLSQMKSGIDNMSLKGILLMLSLLAAFVQIISIFGMYAGVAAVMQKKKVTWLESLEMVPQYFFRLFGARFLAGLAGAGGLLLLVVPGLYITGMLALSSAASVLEKEKIGPLKASWLVSKGNFWRIIGVLLIFVLPILLAVPFLLNKNYIMYAILSAVISFFVTPLSIIAENIMYLELKKLRVKEFNKGKKDGSLEGMGTPAGCGLGCGIYIIFMMLIVIGVFIFSKMKGA